MRWNIAAECISVIILLIIWFYSRQSGLVPSLKNKLFQMCFFITFCAMSFNILSTILLDFPEYAPGLLSWIVTSVYFLATPMMGMAYFFYTVATVYEDQGSELKVMAWTSIPGLLYAVMVLINPFFKELFNIDRMGLYTQGPLIICTYIIFYVYCLAAVILAVIKRRQLDPAIRRILASFPVIAMSVIVIQQLYPTIILSGSAATCALLIIYLYLQNKQNSTDYLTGLPNRQEFLKMLELQIKKSQKFDIIFLSLKNFRGVNDTYGQHSGDLFLKEISSYLSEIADSNCLYRYGGDEFAILSLRRGNSSAERILEKLSKRMQEFWNVSKNSCIISAAIGLVRFPESADTIEGLINGIEFAVVRAKEMPGTEVYYCGHEMLDSVKRRSQIVSILEEHLEHDSFSVFYQPIISTTTGRYTVAESLLRIPDTPLGPLYPDEFIPIAEETGLIVDITYQVLGKVCRFINRLSDAGIEFEGIHVNFSNLQFTQIDLAERVETIIRQNDTPFEKIKIEITESILSENAKAVEKFALRMQERGIQIELDDFGTGYSNINSVMNTPLDTVKLDKSLIWSAMEHQQSAIMVKSITAVFHQMGLQVLAEGVETDRQDQFVRESGIDLIQGFLYSKPLPEEAAFEFLTKK